MFVAPPSLHHTPAPPGPPSPFQEGRCYLSAPSSLPGKPRFPMRVPSLLAVLAGLLLGGCKQSTCGDSCNNFAKVCQSEIAFAKIQFDLLGCAHACEQRTSGCDR